MTSFQTATESRTGPIGARQTRVEDAALLRGQGCYADDAAIPPGTLHAAIIRSPHAHARITSVDFSNALLMKGVHGVLVGEDVKRWALPFPVGVRQPMEHWCVAVDKVRYVGEPVAVVIADSRYLAKDAIEGGRITALRYDQIDDCGAYLRAPEPATFYRMHGNLTGATRFAICKCATGWYSSAQTQGHQSSHSALKSRRLISMSHGDHRGPDFLFASLNQDLTGIQSVPALIILAEFQFADQPSYFNLDPDDSSEHVLHVVLWAVSDLPRLFLKLFMCSRQLGYDAANSPRIVEHSNFSVCMDHSVIPGRNLLLVLVLTRIPLRRNIGVTRPEDDQHLLIRLYLSPKGIVTRDMGS